VANLLPKVKVVAARAKVPALDEWVQHELGGYPDAVEVSAYRGSFHVEVLSLRIIRRLAGSLSQL
jgi:AbiTii